MSKLSKIFLPSVAAVEPQGGNVVLRDSSGAVITPEQTRKAVKARDKNWRDQLRELTGDGALMHANLLNLATGAAKVVTNPVTNESHVQIPGAMVQLEANKFLKETLHGKAVSQGEIHVTEINEVRMAALRAMSEDKLLEIAQTEYTVLRNEPIAEVAPTSYIEAPSESER